MKLADAEAEASRSNRRVKELSSSLSMLQGESTTNERSRIKVTEVNAEVQDLRREYQVRQHCSACVSSATTLNTAVLVGHWLVWTDVLRVRTLPLRCCFKLCIHTGVKCYTYGTAVTTYMPGIL